MSERDQLFHVDAEQAKETLAAGLRRWLPALSWKQVRDLIDARRISINGNLARDPARRLQKGEVVKLHAIPLRPPPKAADIELVHLDDDVVVVNKPAGLTSVRHFEERNWPDRRRQRQPTLDELVPKLIAKKIGSRPETTAPRIRPVHRIDRDTSGLLVLARNENAERHLGKQFRDHSVHRRYLAICFGKVAPATFESDLVENRGDGRRGSSPIPGLGQHAITHVRPIEFFDEFTLVECRLETGRTHQIRIHLAEAGHPLAGDKVYWKPLHRAAPPDSSGAPRLALHAAELGFRHPISEAPLQFHAPMPADLTALLDRLRQK